MYVKAAFCSCYSFRFVCYSNRQDAYPTLLPKYFRRWCDGSILQSQTSQGILPHDKCYNGLWSVHNGDASRQADVHQGIAALLCMGQFTYRMQLRVHLMEIRYNFAEMSTLPCVLKIVNSAWYRDYPVPPSMYFLDSLRCTKIWEGTFRGRILIYNFHEINIHN